MQKRITFNDLKRRAALKKTEKAAKGKQFLPVIVMPDGSLSPTTATSWEEFLRRDDRVTAFHEAAHAVAAWFKKLPLKFMAYKDAQDLSEYNALSEGTPGSYKNGIGAITVYDIPPGPPKDPSTIPALVRALVFGTLSGPQGTAMIPREEQSHTNRLSNTIASHQKQAQFKLQLYPGSLHERMQVYREIEKEVEEFFRRPAARRCVEVLADKFQKQRILTGAEIVQLLDKTWATPTPTKDVISDTAPASLDKGPATTGFEPGVLPGSVPSINHNQEIQ